jgi:hypothetical protein
MPLPANQERASLHQPPRDIAGRQKVYAYERSLGAPPAEACQRAGGKVDGGDAVKWEQNKRVQAWITYFRSLGFSAETLVAAEAEKFGFFDLARLINSALGSGPASVSLEEDAAFNATWQIARWPVFYSSWTFRGTATFLQNPWSAASRGSA